MTPRSQKPPDDRVGEARRRCRHSCWSVRRRPQERRRRFSLVGSLSSGGAKTESHLKRFIAWSDRRPWLLVFPRFGKIQEQPVAIPRGHDLQSKRNAVGAYTSRQ